MPETKSTPSFFIDSILHNDIEKNYDSKEIDFQPTPSYSKPQRINNNQRLCYSFSHCENQRKTLPILDSENALAKSYVPHQNSHHRQLENSYLKSHYDPYYSPNVYSYYNHSYKSQPPNYAPLTVNSSSKPLLSHSTSVVNLSAHDIKWKDVEHSPITDSKNHSSNKVILSEECYLKLLESHRFSEQFKHEMPFKKKRKQRTIFTKQQTDLLESIFRKNEYITLDERSCLSKKLQISEKQVKIWFQNRRNKLKKVNSSLNIESNNNVVSDDTEDEETTNESTPKG